MKSRPNNPRDSRAIVNSNGYAWLISFLLGVMVATVFLRAPSFQSPSELGSKRQADASTAFPTLGDLVAMSPKQLEQQDLALLNLRCAEGLPGASDLNIEQCLSTLDGWADRVKAETQRHLYKYSRDPEEYDNSEPYFRMLMLITVLQQDYGVHYNADRIRNIDFTKSQDLFIHGLIASRNGGTCVSMPALYTAISQRLGYPVKMVTSKEHVFCRWDDGEERFNIEATNQGMSKFDDSYYLKWPSPISDEELKSGDYLQSLSNANALSVFLAARGHCLEDNGDLSRARVCYAQAAVITPQTVYQDFLARSMGVARMSRSQRTDNTPLYYRRRHSAGVPSAGYQQPAPPPFTQMKPTGLGITPLQFNSYQNQLLPTINAEP